MNELSDRLERLGARINLSTTAAVGVALTLLVASIGLGLFNEHLGIIEREQQATTQAQILAGSLAGPLAFDDVVTAREYVGALRANGEVGAVAAYSHAGRLVAGYSTDGQRLPPANVLAPPRLRDGHLVVTAPVAEGGARLGSVYLRTVIEPWWRRAIRYLGIGLLVVMASLLVAVLGAAQASTRAAHVRLMAEVAERQKAEEALRQSQKMEAMGQLTGGVAHDFNNLLMVASSGLDLLEKTNDPARRERLKGAIRQAIDRGASLTQQLLAFARRSALKPEVIDPAALLGGMRELLDRTLSENILIHMRLEPTWPVEVDASQLEVAVLNIAVNARDAMDGGGTLTLASRNEPDGRVRLSVADTGSGIDPEMIERVFEPFYTTKAVGQGTGLGLSQVYGFVRSSGGEVQIESALGQGTTVSILLPRSDKPVPSVLVPASVDINPGSVATRVLMVEDDDNVAALVQDMFEELGYGVVRAVNAVDALNRLEASGPFQLVFSDMVMPGDMNGLELARAISHRHPGLPILLTTGFSNAAVSAAAEGIRLLVKPYRIDALAAEVKSALQPDRDGEAKPD